MQNVSGRVLMIPDNNSFIFSEKTFCQFINLIPCDFFFQSCALNLQKNNYDIKFINLLAPCHVVRKSLEFLFL